MCRIETSYQQRRALTRPQDADAVCSAPSDDPVCCLADPVPGLRLAAPAGHRQRELVAGTQRRLRGAHQQGGLPDPAQAVLLAGVGTVRCAGATRAAGHEGLGLQSARVQPALGQPVRQRTVGEPALQLQPVAPALLLPAQAGLAGLAPPSS
jgi:hypothetical protein